MFDREQPFGNSCCQVLCWFAGSVSIQAALTRAWAAHEKQQFIPHGSGAGKVQVQVLTDSASGEGTIPVSSCGEVMREPCSPFYKDTHPIHVGSTLMTCHFPVATLLVHSGN